MIYIHASDSDSDETLLGLVRMNEGCSLAHLIIRVPSVATIKMTSINTYFCQVLLYFYTLFIIIDVHKEIYSKSSHRNIRKYYSVHRKLLIYMEILYYRPPHRLRHGFIGLLMFTIVLHHLNNFINYIKQQLLSYITLFIWIYWSYWIHLQEFYNCIHSAWIF